MGGWPSGWVTRWVAGWMIGISETKTKLSLCWTELGKKNIIIQKTSSYGKDKSGGIVGSLVVANMSTIH